MKKISFKKSFTLIELMTVIGIIAILAGLMLVGYNIFFSEANIGSSMRFDSSIHHSLGYALVGDWKLDDNADNSTVVDSSGNGNDGTFHNAANNYTSENSVDGANGRALHFDGSGNEYITTPLNVNISDSGYSISLWAKSEGGDASYYMPAGFSNSYYWYIAHYKPATTDVWMYSFHDENNSHYDIRSVSNVIENEWYYVAAINNGENQKLYINGKQNSSSSVSGFNQDSITISIGNYLDSGGSYPFKGVVDQTRVYKAALSASQIKQQYYTGLQRLYKKGLISREEYIKRIVQK